MLYIDNLHVSIGNKKILKGLQLEVGQGETHALMGPNGSGKSTLTRVIAGDPSYEVTEGSIHFLGKNILELEPEKRAQLGLFIGFQYPTEIPGISNIQFLHAAYTACKGAISMEEFSQKMSVKMELMRMDPSFKERHLNSGFSGGEKKKNEILQLLLLEPSCAILDETDSGLDVDAIHVIVEGISQFSRKNSSLLLITHYKKLLDQIPPDQIHVIIDGKIVERGGGEIAHKLEKQGFHGY